MGIDGISSLQKEDTIVFCFQLSLWKVTGTLHLWLDQQVYSVLAENVFSLKKKTNAGTLSKDP